MHFNCNEQQTLYDRIQKLSSVKIVLLDLKSCWRMQKCSTNNWRRSKSWYTINIKSKTEDPLCFDKVRFWMEVSVRICLREKEVEREMALFIKGIDTKNSVLECKLLLRKALAEIYREVQFLSFFRKRNFSSTIKGVCSRPLHMRLINWKECS